MKEQLYALLEEDLADRPLADQIRRFGQRFIDLHIDRTEQFKSDLRSVLKKYNAANKHNLPGNLVFLRNTGEYNLEIWYEDEAGCLAPDPDFGEILSEHNYLGMEDPKLKDSAEDDRFSEGLMRTEEAMFFTWLSAVWQTIDGQQCRLMVMVNENSHSDMFFLNDFLNHDHSSYYGLDTTVKEYEPHFEQKLSLVEIYERVKLGID